MTLAINALGTRINVEFFNMREPNIRAIRRAWDGCAADPGSSADHTIHVGLLPTPQNLDQVVAARTVAEVSELLSQRVTALAIDAQHERHLLLHAAGILVPETGTVLALVAPSGTGKTTAALTLARSGYCTDETVAVDRVGTVLPYPKPLSVIERKGAPKRQISPAQAGLTSVTDRHPLGGIVLLERNPAAKTPQIESLDMIDALTLIAPQVSYLSARQRPLHQLRDLVHSVGGAHRIRYAEAADLTRMLARLANPSEVRPVYGHSERPDAPHPLSESSKPSHAGAYARETIIDVLHVGGAELVLNGRNLTLLSEVGTAIWGVLEHPQQIEELGDALGVTDLELLRTRVDELISAGILRQNHITESDTA